MTYFLLGKIISEEEQIKTFNKGTAGKTIEIKVKDERSSPFPFCQNGEERG